MRCCLILCALTAQFISQYSFAQTLGGTSIFNFLKLPQHPLTASLGGRNVSSLSTEAGLIAENPALMRDHHHGNISTNFTLLSSGLNALVATGVYNINKISTNLGLTIGHIGYGQTTQTDGSGNTMGSFNPYDQYIQVNASRKYGSRWNYGIAMKFIHSNYGPYQSSGLVSDMGLAYFDEEKKLQAGFSAKNMGVQLSKYADIGEDLPFDMVIGVTKQLDKAPLRFSLTAQRLHQFDLLYNDTLFNNSNFRNTSKNSFHRKLLSHFIIGTELLISEKLVLMGGYNVLRSMEMRLSSLTNGLTGLSYGLDLKLARFDFYFSRSHYQSSIVHNQMGITYRLAQNKDQK